MSHGSGSNLSLATLKFNSNLIFFMKFGMRFGIRFANIKKSYI